MQQLSFVLFAGGAASVAVSLIALMGRAALGFALGLVTAPLRGVALAVPGGTLHVDGRPGSRGGGVTEGYARALALVGTGALAASLVARGVAAGTYPLSNMFDFSIALATGILTALWLADARYHLRGLELVLMPVAVALLGYAAFLSPALRPPVPALQAPELLSLHVSVALVAYSSFAVAFGAATLDLASRWLPRGSAPSASDCDEVAYTAAALGFPFMTLVLTLGAYWANQAWGRYWGWDPKESAALTTWLVYGAYLHLHPHRREASRWLLVLGFIAVLVTYFGNLFLRGLHAYA